MVVCTVGAYRGRVSPRRLTVADQGDYKHECIDSLEVGNRFLALRASPTNFRYVERATDKFKSYFVGRAWLTTTTFEYLFILSRACMKAKIDTVSQTVGMLTLST